MLLLKHKMLPDKVEEILRLSLALSQNFAISWSDSNKSEKETFEVNYIPQYAELEKELSKTPEDSP